MKIATVHTESLGNFIIPTGTVIEIPICDRNGVKVDSVKLVLLQPLSVYGRDQTVRVAWESLKGNRDHPFPTVDFWHSNNKEDTNV